MRTPKWFREELAKQGARLVTRNATEAEAAAAILTRAADEPNDFPGQILTDYITRQLRAYCKQNLPYAPEEATGQGDLFPELPRRMEISPGRFADQAVMARRDWDAARKQVHTKRDNVQGFADRFDQVYDFITPLLTDDTMTTAEALKRHGQRGQQAIGGE